jgi:dihydrofolate reductase
LTTKYASKIETIYAIGGSSIYRETLTYPSDILHRIYLTRVFSSDSQCDVFLEPANFLESFEKLTSETTKENIFDAEFNVIHNDPSNNLEYVFEVYEKKQPV